MLHEYKMFALLSQVIKQFLSSGCTVLNRLCWNFDRLYLNLNKCSKILETIRVYLSQTHNISNYVILLPFFPPYFSSALPKRVHFLTDAEKVYYYWRKSFFDKHCFCLKVTCKVERKSLTTMS